ncbi:MAG: hypothetical protein MJZ15_01545 [Bacteroidales bacterium]|nr:hypothetical protein [Bacteroidales bacterium]
MKKKIVFLSVLAAMSVSMTSCIDNDEPAGLEALRKGQAEKLNGEGAYQRAKAEMELANAAYRLAETAEQEAKAALQLIKNQEEEVVLATKKLALAVAEAANAALIKAEEVNLEKQVSLLAVEKLKTEAAIAAQDQTTKEAIAKVELALAQLKDVDNATLYPSVATKRAAVVTKTQALTTAQNNLTEAQKKRAAAADLLTKDNLEVERGLTNDVQDAQQAVELEKFKIEFAKNALEEFKALMEKDSESWAKELAQLKADEKAIADEKDVIDVKLAEMAAEDALENKKLAQATKAAEDALADAKKDLNKELTEYSDSAKYFSFELATAIAEDVTAPANFEIKGGKLVSKETIKNSDAASKLADLKSYAQGKADAATAEIVAKKNIDKTKLENASKDLKKTADDDVKDYTEKLAAYKTALGTSEESAKESDFQAASNKAYGELRYTAFTTDELADMHKNHTLSGKGSYGAYQEALLAIADLQKEIGQANGWNALNNAVKSELKTIEDKTAAYNAKIDQASLNKLVEAVAAAKKAEADATQAQTDAKKPLNNEKDVLDVKKTEIATVISAVEGAISLVDNATIGSGDYVSEADVKTYVAKQILTKQQAIEDAEEALVKKEVAVAQKEALLKIFKEKAITEKAGAAVYNLAVENAEKAVVDAQAAYDKAKAEFDAAVASLELVLKTITE